MRAPSDRHFAIKGEDLSHDSVSLHPCLKLSFTFILNMIQGLYLFKNKIHSST